MTWVLVCVALGNLVIGYYLGTLLLLPAKLRTAELVTTTVSESATLQAGMIAEIVTPHVVNNIAQQETTIQETAKDNAPESRRACWNNACTDIRQDIATFYDRIRYSISANDKKLARMIAAELEKRIPSWQKLLEQKLAWNLAEAAHNPAAKVDCVAPELCLAQTETLQTNLGLLEWSDSTESILRKLEREVEAVRHLLPADC